VGTIHYLTADGTERIESGDSAPDYSACERFLGGSRETVWVLYKGKRTCMFVHENGIAMGLPVNVAATEIYCAWPRSQGMDVSGRHIHGNAIVLEDIPVH
jgi:hypothetical protein